jgi:Fe-Mn family superoxide dismutase
MTVGLAVTMAAGSRPGLFAPARAADPVFKVPPLGYGYDALDPYIDTLTMTIHHDPHLTRGQQRIRA